MLNMCAGGITCVTGPDCLGACLAVQAHATSPGHSKTPFNCVGSALGCRCMCMPYSPLTPASLCHAQLPGCMPVLLGVLVPQAARYCLRRAGGGVVVVQACCQQDGRDQLAC
jgi:hypothetical protein